MNKNVEKGELGMKINAIGTISSPYLVKGDAPRQGIYSKEVMTLNIDEEYQMGMTNLEKAEYIMVLYWGDRAKRNTLLGKPPGQEEVTGVFACRSPNRPNPISVCVAKIIDIQGTKIKVIGLDALDGSPIVDIKPYVAMLDNPLR